MKIKNNSAIALILSVGVLAVLAMITIGFSAFTRMELQATENQTNLLKASYIAQAGIAQVIEDIKYDASFGAVNEPYDSALDPWYYQGNGNYDGSIIDLALAANPSYGKNISYAGGYYRLKVIDCGGLININCPLPDGGDLGSILNELGQILGVSGLSNIVSYRSSLPGQVFTSKEEIKLVPGIGQATYDLVKDYITLWGDEDDGIIDLDKTAGSVISPHTGKSFINVNTASEQVLQAVFRPMMNSDSQADALANAIIDRTRRDTNPNPFDGLNPTAGVFNFLDARGEFERYIEYAVLAGTINDTNRDAILSQSDPNSYSPTNTDSTNSAIIGFDANGYYEIEAIGTYRGAKKRIKQAVSVFRKINQTTKDEFRIHSSSVATQRVSWKDTCPVDFTQLKQFQYSDDIGDSPDPADYILNSLKLGFWDNFQEDYDSTNPNPDGAGKKGPWTAIHETYTINDAGNGLLVTLVPGTITQGMDYHPLIELDSSVCIVDNFAMIAHGIDETSLSKYALRDDLPWPAVPAEWWFWAPAPDASNCPDIGTNVRDADGNDVLDAMGNPTLIDAQYILNNTSSSFLHQQYLNTLHISFGGIQTSTGNEWMSAIFCNNIQDKDLFFNNIIDKRPVYQNWVRYDVWHGYIYFSPSPPLGPGWEEWFQTCLKPYDVVRTGNVMVTCNQWSWGGHPADLGTEYFPITGGAYYAEKTFHLKGLGRWSLRGEVYLSNIITESFSTSEQVMVYQDRYFKISGLGNLPDLDYFRVVPGQGVYTSQMLSPTASMGSGRFIEWGTIQAHVTLPATADSVREPVYLETAASAPSTSLSQSYIPGTIILPSGGPIGATAMQSICYQTYLFSDFGELDLNNTDFEQAPVVEDVTITYLPQTQIVNYNAR